MCRRGTLASALCVAALLAATATANAIQLIPGTYCGSEELFDVAFEVVESSSYTVYVFPALGEGCFMYGNYAMTGDNTATLATYEWNCQHVTLGAAVQAGGTLTVNGTSPHVAGGTFTVALRMDACALTQLPQQQYCGALSGVPAVLSINRGVTYGVNLFNVPATCAISGAYDARNAAGVRIANTMSSCGNLVTFWSAKLNATAGGLQVTTSRGLHFSSDLLTPGQCTGHTVPAGTYCGATGDGFVPASVDIHGSAFYAVLYNATGSCSFNGTYYRTNSSSDVVYVNATYSDMCTGIAVHAVTYQASSAGTASLVLRGVRFGAAFSITLTQATCAAHTVAAGEYCNVHRDNFTVKMRTDGELDFYLHVLDHRSDAPLPSCDLNGSFWWFTGTMFVFYYATFLTCDLTFPVWFASYNHTRGAISLVAGAQDHLTYELTSANCGP